MTIPASDQTPGQTSGQTSPASGRYRASRVAHWNQVARLPARRRTWSTAYHRRLTEVYRFLIPPGMRVLDVGCGTGDLLAAVQPTVGVGIDFAEDMLEQARQRHPELRFLHVDAHDLVLDETFDFIILSDLINDLWDVQTVFERLARLTTPSTRIIINSYSRLWELPLSLAARLGLSRPTLTQNWLTVEDIANLLDLADFELIRHWEEVVWPLTTPVVERAGNRVLAKVWPTRLFALTNFLVARPRPEPSAARPAGAGHAGAAAEPSVSIIVPARNEAGNIEEIFRRTPRLGRSTELVFVEGHSRDATYATIEQAITAHPEWRCTLSRQTGVGKGDAVRRGFSQATGEILMILDADLTMPPEELPRFYEVLRGGKGDFANGVRLVYPMEQEAMRFFNILGNKFFSLAFSWLLGQPIKDTLCGTKVLWRTDYLRIAAHRAYFGDFDPFGDFDLLFGAARLGLKIVEVPIRYRQRTYGTTNISRWRHGVLLLRMVIMAARKLKFV